MFEVIDDALLNYQNYSKQLFSITNQHKDYCNSNLNGDENDINMKAESEHNTEKDILKTQLSRMIIDTDNKIMQVHFEYFAKRLMQLF